MEKNYKIIDQSNWKRAIHCAIFQKSMQPRFCVSFDLDVTVFRKMVKEKGYSFTLAMTYLVSRAANEIEEFRYRFLDGEVVLYDKINTSFTYINKETELFKVVNVPMMETLEEYINEANKIIENQKVYFTGPMGNDVFQFSSMPWVAFHYISHTYSGNNQCATPMFDWGKYDTKGEQMILPFSVQVHHSFVDGIHIGRLVEKLNRYLENPSML